MATEGTQVKDFPEIHWDDKNWYAKEQAWWDKAEAEGRRFVRFPIADGEAVYEVRGVKRYKLHHVPVGDAWRIPASHLRGLRKVDIDRDLGWQDTLGNLFGQRKGV